MEFLSIERMIKEIKKALSNYFSTPLKVESYDDFVKYLFDNGASMIYGRVGQNDCLLEGHAHDLTRVILNIECGRNVSERQRTLNMAVDLLQETFPEAKTQRFDQDGNWLGYV